MMDGYSRLVAILKVALPLAALGILSTLFLLSRSVDPTATLPFGDAEISERLQREIITAPNFTGVTPRGDQISLTAATARPEAGGRKAQTEDMTVLITLSSGGAVTLEAATGSFDPDADIARFAGDVKISTTSGYVLTTDALETGINSLGAKTDGPVQGQSPLGRLEAGQLVLTSDAESQDAHLVFKNGVKLIYDPKNVKDTP